MGKGGMSWRVAQASFPLTEEGEVDATVGAMSDEMGILGEVLRLAVLQDEEAAGIQ